MKLYDDVEPLRIAGYASTFGCDYQTGEGSWERVGRGAFTLSAARPIALCIAHDHGKRYAWTSDKSLALWADHHGLAFEARVAWNAGALPLATGIRRGELVGCSVGFTRREVEVVNAGDREVELVRRAEIEEISVVSTPKCPHTALWIADDSQDEMPPDLALARACWQVGKMQAQLAAARRPGARARAAAGAGLTKAVAGREARAVAVPASVLHVLARHGPRGV